MILLRGTADAQATMERRLRGDPVLRTTQCDYPLIPFTHVREVSPPVTRTSPMILQLADALEQT
eukprot:11748029-Alexandrium_andersonii.AAC.1